jgi:hypothetical protein
MGMLATFVERWHEEINNFHIHARETTITLDYVSCLLHLPIEGCLLNYTDIISKA